LQLATLTLNKLKDELACITFQPRPNQHDRNDQQQAFYDSEHEGVTFLLGGNGAGTTTCGLAKAVKFMTIDQPAPRKDTPFWIIAGSYPQVMNACWKEKLHQKGHLDPNAVDWNRINWYKPNQDWPFSVPLKPRKNHPGKNWLICFKSYEQGREAMQAEAIGGFLFVEQFPWGLLNEVMRGCREYSFRGNKLAEFTPVDPSMSIELRDMEETGKLPKSWGLYRANTRCALEAGQISESWYRDFFAMIPDAMKPVREQGLWGNFEGAVYPEFSPAIHCTPEGWDIPPGAQHRRAVDFGFSQEHAFVALWSCADGRGRVTIYDEYYSKDTTLSVIDHWKAIEDRNPWPKNTAGRYGVTWMDHDLDAIRTLSKIEQYTNGEYTAPNWSLAIKAVNEGIEYVKYMLKPSIIVDPNEPPSPRLQIVRDRCPNLMREMITYRRPKQLSESINANAVSQDPVKIDDDCCFPAGSMVDTPNGPRPIESLKAGDLVYSHLGIATIDVSSIKTGQSETITITLDDRRSIECTANHPIATGFDGWSEAINCGGKLLNVRLGCELKQTEMDIPLRLSNTAASSGGDTRHTMVMRLGHTSGDTHEKDLDRSSCTYFTSKSTSTITEQFQKGTTYTTGTKIQETTIRQILSRSQNRNTARLIQGISKRRSSPLSTGIKAKKVCSGTLSTEKSLGTTEHLTRSLALNAAKSLKQETQRKRLDSVQASADTMPESRLALTISISPARSAARRSEQTATQRRRFARKNVNLVSSVSIEKNTGEKNVYNLSTSDGTYFVNGVLVSNCDALRYILFSEASMSGVTPTTLAKQHSTGSTQLDSPKFRKRGRRK